MDAARKKTAAAISSVVWSCALTGMKFVVALATGSLGLLSEALHSGLDLLAALGTLYAVRIAALPADEDHPYGHGKVENLTALAETLLLLVTAVWVVKEAVERLMSEDAATLQVQTSVWAFAVVIISLAVDVNRSRMLRRVASETKSAALEADAAHFTTDIWSSAAVLLGISGAALAEFAIDGSWLHWLLMRADVFASLVVAALVLHVCRELGCKAVNNLMDKADGASAAAVRAAMQERMAAYPVEQLRVRESGNTAYVAMVVAVPREMHVDTAHEIADAIEQLVGEVLPGAETMVHMQPRELTAPTPEFMVRQIALTHRFGVHGLVMLRTDEGRLIIFTDLELPPEAKLDAWQVAIEAFRSDVRRRLGAHRVIVHVEPDVRQLRRYDTPLPEPDALQQQVRRAMVDMGAPLPLRVELYRHGDSRLCLVTIAHEGGLTVEECHKRLGMFDKQLAAALPGIARFIVTYSRAKGYR